MNLPNVNNRKRLRIHTLILSLVTLLGTLPTVRATDWGFNLIKGPTAETDDGEILRMTGSGTFNPAAHTAAGGGSFSVVNAFDEVPTTGIMRGTWVVTGFGNFSSDGGLNPGVQGGTLNVEIAFSFEVGIVGLTLPGTLTVVCPFDGLAFDEVNDGIGVFVPAVNETFATLPGAAPGSTVFHLIKR